MRIANRIDIYKVSNTHTENRYIDFIDTSAKQTMKRFVGKLSFDPRSILGTIYRVPNHVCKCIYTCFMQIYTNIHKYTAHMHVYACISIKIKIGMSVILCTPI